MIDAKQIPPEVVEAVARVLAACHSTEANWEMFLPRARAAIVAALNAWPDVVDTHPSNIRHLVLQFKEVSDDT